MSTEQKEHLCASCGGVCTGMCWKQKIAKSVVLLAIAGSLFLLALFASELKAYQFVGKDVPGELVTIAVSGEGEAFAIPDIAEISFAITHEAKTPAEARAKVDEKMATIEKFLETNGVDKKDIKTTGYNLYPKYEWQQPRAFPCNEFRCPPTPPGKQILLGYEVTQSINVKIRKIDNAGTVLGGLTDKGAANVSGLTFKVDNEDAVKEEARNEAISKAKIKAKKLADELDVNLVRMTSFHEGGNYPIYDYARSESVGMKASVAVAPVPATIPVGENTYTSNVTIVYEVR